MSSTAEILKRARQYGFTHVGELNMSALEFLPAVRDMCASGHCRKYGACWTCPPACGTPEDAARQAGKYRRGILLQTTAFLKDNFDFESMQQAETAQKTSFTAFVEYLRQEYPHCLPMSTGGCTVCAQCTYPDAPCRFPEKAIPSMEAYGLLVSQVCEGSGLPYYYGPGTLTYTACVLID